jgi:hypothetical protein
MRIFWEFKTVTGGEKSPEGGSYQRKRPTAEFLREFPDVEKVLRHPVVECGLVRSTASW